MQLWPRWIHVSRLITPGPAHLSCLLRREEERTGLGGDHYLDTRLTNEAWPGRRLCCRRCCWLKTARIFFLCPPPGTQESTHDRQIARCCGHGNKHTHTPLLLLRACPQGTTNCSAPCSHPGVDGRQRMGTRGGGAALTTQERAGKLSPRIKRETQTTKQGAMLGRARGRAGEGWGC